MSASRVTMIVIGTIVGLVGLALLLAGVGLLAADAQRGADGYFTSPEYELSSDGYAITAEDIDLAAEADPAEWTPNFGAFTTRLTVAPQDAETPVFAGIGLESDVDAYLDDVAHDRLGRLGDQSSEVTYESAAGESAPAPPTEQDFWVASSAGAGTQTVTWEPESGRWAVVVMNADGSQAPAVTATAAVQTGVLTPIGIALVVFGLLALGGAIALIVGAVASGTTAAPARVEEPLPGTYPLHLEGRLDPELSRWQWLVKWILAIPHFIVLVFLWIAFAIVTFLAGIAILFTGRYPRGLFEFTSGVLRWTWRVAYYSYGVLGTDQYPPFTLADVDYPARLQVAYPEQLSRGLVLIKWWLLAIPHYIILDILLGGDNTTTVVQVNDEGWTVVDTVTTTGGGLIAVLVFFAAVGLLFTGRYLRSLYDLIMGLNRWVYRVIAYAALMTDQYPPFRLDSGGAEPPPEPRTPAPDDPGTAAKVEPTQQGTSAPTSYQ